nr:MAG TPA: hypothetical protein [Caudoviricetes sp.]
MAGRVRFLRLSAIIQQLNVSELLFFRRNITYLKRCREIQMFLFQRATVY